MTSCALASSSGAQKKRTLSEHFSYNLRSLARTSRSEPRVKTRAQARTASMLASQLRELGAMRPQTKGCTFRIMFKRGQQSKHPLNTYRTRCYECGMTNRGKYKRKNSRVYSRRMRRLNSVEETACMVTEGWDQCVKSQIERYTEHDRRRANSCASDA